MPLHSSGNSDISNSGNLSRIAIVIVNLNSYDDTAVCLESLTSISYPSYEVIVVDNGSTDGSGNRLKQAFPWITLLSSNENLGFTGGNNLGIEAGLKKAEHILLLNNDTIVTKSFLEPLVHRLEQDPSIAAVSGKIYYAPAAIGGRRNILWYAGCFQKWHTGYHHYGVMEEDTGKYDKARIVPYASGCLMLIRGELIRKLGALSSEFFIYWEEADWCRRALDNGYVCYYEPKSVIYHNFKSAPRGGESPFYMYMQTRNGFIYAHKHYRGFELMRYWMFYPIYLTYRLLLDLKAGNVRGAKALLWGAVDYFRGFRGTEGLRERGFLWT